MVLQEGFMSELINIERGCKQGDPIASYLLAICAQFLFILIYNKATAAAVIASLRIDNNGKLKEIKFYYMQRLGYIKVQLHT